MRIRNPNYAGAPVRLVVGAVEYQGDDQGVFDVSEAHGAQLLATPHWESLSLPWAESEAEAPQEAPQEPEEPAADGAPATQPEEPAEAPEEPAMPRRRRAARLPE